MKRATVAPRPNTKSWAVRVLVCIALLSLCFVVLLLGRSKGGTGFGTTSDSEEKEGPTLRVKVPATGDISSISSTASESQVDSAVPNAFKPTVKQIESGLYRPDTSRSLEHYAGAWLVSRRRLMEAKLRIRAIKSLEGASFSVAGLSSRQDPRIALMTRDYFDFSVQHLSSTTNQLPWNAPKDFLDLVHEQTVQIVERLQARAEVPKDHSTHISPLSDDPRRTEETVALIPFCNRAASVDSRLETAWNNNFQAKVRLLFMQATFWSVYRVFPRIIVTVGTDADLKILLEMNLPIWKTVNMKALFNESAPIRSRGSVHFLPKESLMFLMEKLADSSTEHFSKFKYVYYTEADHVLQLRSADQLFNAMDNSQGRFAIAPHRLQTILLPRLFTPAHRLLWRTNKWQAHLVESLKDKRLIVEHEDPLGSCCDNGRFYFAPCGNWWYNCPDWGLRNYTDWIRFGDKGYTLPTGTEHAARCVYSEMRKLCPKPINCKARVPKSDAEVCGEVSNVEVTYGWDPNAPDPPPPRKTKTKSKPKKK